MPLVEPVPEVCFENATGAHFHNFQGIAKPVDYLQLSLPIQLG